MLGLDTYGLEVFTPDGHKLIYNADLYDTTLRLTGTGTGAGTWWPGGCCRVCTTGQVGSRLPSLTTGQVGSLSQSWLLLASALSSEQWRHATSPPAIALDLPTCQRSRPDLPTVHHIQGSSSTAEGDAGSARCPIVHDLHTSSGVCSLPLTAWCNVIAAS